MKGKSIDDNIFQMGCKEILFAIRSDEKHSNEMSRKIKFLITGATGYIGSQIIRYLLKNTQNDSIQIAAIVRKIEKVETDLKNLVQLIEMDICNSIDMGGITEHFDYVIHCASVTKSSDMIKFPVEVFDSIVLGTKNILELTKRCGCKSMVYLSSMEVYGDVNCSDGHRVSEEEMGYIDVLNVRSCYPLGKRAAENLCYCYHKEYGVPVKIVRLAQTFGKGILHKDNRVFAQFARSVLEGNDIILHTAGNSMGNYCCIDDAVIAIIKIMEHGEEGEAYNVVNEENTMTIKEMAELVCSKIAEGRIKVVFDIPEENCYGYAADTGVRLSGKKLMELGWKPSKNMIDMVKETIDTLAGKNK